MLTRNESGKIRLGFDGDLLAVKQAIEDIARLAAMIDLDDVKNLQQHFNQVETLGPLFDPTAYMDVSDNLHEHKKLIAAFAAFRFVIESFRPPAKDGDANG